MKNIIYIIGIFLLLEVVTSCSVEAPFTPDENIGEGKFLSKALSLKLNKDENLVRSANDVNIDDFNVDIYLTENDNEPVKSFRYGDMPEVVTLPVGSYKIKAYYGGTYGDNPNAAFNAPYYNGESSNFSIEKDKIQNNIGTIVCCLANVKVSVFFDEKLAKAMGNDSKVEVQVGNSGPLFFSRETQESGFFAYEETTQTITAKFSGSIDGDDVEETKSYKNVSPGNHYRITFKLHIVDPNDPGDIVAEGDEGDEIKIDANIQTIDMSEGDGVDVGTPNEEDIYMEDDRYSNGNEDDPGNGDDPSQSNGPVVTASDGIDLDGVNVVTDEMECELMITSETGIQSFTVDIDSNTLTPEELEGVSLSAHLDLVNPGDMEEALKGLGFPVNIGGKKEVKFNISEFLPLLKVLGEGDHNFILTISDSEGKTVKTLKLKTN